MNIVLDSESEQMVLTLLAEHKISSPEELIRLALKAYSDKPNLVRFGRLTMSPAEAVDDIMELRQGLSLDGLKIKDLINEGRKY